MSICFIVCAAIFSNRGFAQNACRSVYFDPIKKDFGEWAGTVSKEINPKNYSGNNSSSIQNAKYLGDSFVCESNKDDLDLPMLIMMIGNLDGLPRSPIAQSLVQFEKFKKSGYRICVGNGSPISFAKVWMKPEVEHLIYIGHGEGGLLKSSDSDFNDLDPKILPRKSRLKTLNLISCEALKNAFDWKAAAPNAVILGAERPIRVVMAPILTSVTDWAIDRQAKTKKGELVDVTDFQKFIMKLVLPQFPF